MQTGIPPQLADGMPVQLYAFRGLDYSGREHHPAQEKQEVVDIRSIFIFSAAGKRKNRPDPMTRADEKSRGWLD